VPPRITRARGLENNTPETDSNISLKDLVPVYNPDGMICLIVEKFYMPMAQFC